MKRSISILEVTRLTSWELNKLELYCRCRECTKERRRARARMETDSKGMETFGSGSKK